MALRFDIFKESDFEALRYLENCQNKNEEIIIILRNDIEFSREFKPLNLFGYTIIFKGKHHTLSNIAIINHHNIDGTKDVAGMFSMVKNLYVNNLNINKSYIYEGQVSGTLAGEVEEELLIDKCNFQDLVVNSEAYCGGVAGVANNVTIRDSYISSHVYGIDVVGGVVGMSRSYTEIDSNNTSEIIGIGKCLGEKVGYTDRKNIRTLNR